MYFILFLLANCLITFCTSFNYDSSCGIRSFNIPESRIIGGRQAKEGEFPWQVSIASVSSVSSTNNPSHFCGGAILSKNTIITAAHCMKRM